LVFDGSNDSVDITTNSSLNSYPLTVSTWFKSTTSSAYRMLVNKSVASSFNGYALYLNSGYLCAFYLSGSGSTNKVDDGTACPLQTTVAYNDGNWHHVIFTVDGSGGKLYVDGVQRSSRAWTGTPTATTTTENLHLGYFPGLSYYTNMTLDDVKIYSYELSAEEVKLDYNHGSALQLGSSTDPGSTIYSDTFGSDSSLSSSWTGSTWSVSGGKAVNTPTLGSELITNGAFDSDTTWFKGTNWSISDGALHATSAPNTSTTSQSFSGSAQNWYYTQFNISNYSSGSVRSYAGSNGGISPTYNTNGAKLYTSRFLTGGASSFYLEANGSTNIYDIDDVSLKSLTLSSLFSTVSTSKKDVVASADVTLTAGTQAGIVTNLDSAGTPANFLVAYHNGTNVYLDKNVGGTYTNLISAAATYSSGAKLEVRTYHSDANTLKVSVYYNGTIVGTEQTVTDAGIISNTIHGMFSTYSGNTLDNFTLKNQTINYDYCIPGSSDYCGAPVAEWKMDEGTGTSANDTSGNSNTGSFGAGSAAPTWTSLMGQMTMLMPTVPH